MDFSAQTFAQLDPYNTGFLGKSQVHQCLQTYSRLERSFAEKTVEYFMTKFGGTNNNNLCIDLPAFRSMMAYIENLHDMFSQFDANGSDSLNLTELSRVFQNPLMTTDAATIQRLGVKYDLDKSGVLEFDEFCQLMVEWDLYKKIFDEADLDRNAHISLDELHGVMCRLNNEFVAVFSEQWKRPFSRLTCIALLHRFSGYGDEVANTPSRSPTSTARHFELGFAHFGEMIIYLIDVKDRFVELDHHNDGKLCAQEVFLALHKFLPSGRFSCNPTKDLTKRVMGLYDTSHNGFIEFDEFCHFLIEWEEYLDRYRRHAHDAGINSYGLQIILGDLPDVRSLAIKNADGSRPAEGYLFEARDLMSRFDLNTCQCLVSKFGTNPNEGSLNMVQYMDMIYHLKNLKITFTQNNLIENGKLPVSKVEQGFASTGLNLSHTALNSIIQSYFTDDSVNILSLNFDHFVQMQLELEVVSALFSTNADGNGVVHLHFEQMQELVFRLQRNDNMSSPIFASVADSQGVAHLNFEQMLEFIFKLPRTGFSTSFSNYRPAPVPSSHYFSPSGSARMDCTRDFEEL